MGEQGSHPEISELIALHWGDLPTARREAVKAHLAVCSVCRRLVGEHRRFLRERRSPEEPDARLKRQLEWRRLCDRLANRSTEPDEESG